MGDAIHLQIYRRFFAVLFSVIPGLNLILGLGVFMLWLFADVIEVDWGWGVGVAAVTMLLCLVTWVLVGLPVQKWAEQKSTGVLIGLCSPFMILDAIALAYLFWYSVIADHEEEASAAARMVIQTVSMLG